VEQVRVWFEQSAEEYRRWWTLFGSIGSLRERLFIIALNGDKYADALQASSGVGIVGALDR